MKSRELPYPTVALSGVRYTLIAASSSRTAWPGGTPEPLLVTSRKHMLEVSSRRSMQGPVLTPCFPLDSLLGVLKQLHTFFAWRLLIGKYVDILSTAVVLFQISKIAASEIFSAFHRAGQILLPGSKADPRPQHTTNERVLWCATAAVLCGAVPTEPPLRLHSSRRVHFHLWKSGNFILGLFGIMSRGGFDLGILPDSPRHDRMFVEHSVQSCYL